MSLSIDLTTYGKQLQKVYDDIISGSPRTSWAVFSYDKGASNELKVQAQGNGELEEMVDEFSDGRVSYGFVRVEDPNTKLNKFVLIGWCGEGVPEHKKGLFHSHFVAVAKFLKGYHVQITARSEADLDPATILKKVADSSGSKYSQIMSKFETSPQSKRGPPISPSVSAAFGRSPGFRGPRKDDDGWGDAPAITANVPSKVQTAYQPTKVDMAALRAGKSDTVSSGPPSAPEVVKSAYTPVGKVDIAALRAQSQDSAPAKPARPAQTDSYVGTTGYTPISLPKPKPLGGAKFGSSVARGTVPPMPTGPLRESKAIGGASKNFGADKSGKTPSQLWAERKARDRGGNASVIPDIAPASPLSRAQSPPASPGTYVEDSSAVIGKPVSGGVKAMRERFARQSIDGELPISPGGERGYKPASPVHSQSPPLPVTPPAPSPPPIAVSSKPVPARTYQSLDDVVAAGAGASVGIGVAALAQQHREPTPPPQETWDHAHEPVYEDEEEVAAREASQMHAQQEHEPEPEPEEHEEQHHGAHETEAQSTKVAVVLFEYEAQEENEINLVEGQIITNIEFIDEVHLDELQLTQGWWSGDDPHGQNGLFPSNYVELQEHEPADIPAVPLSTHKPENEPEPEPEHEGHEKHEGEGEGESAIAEYEYEAQEENELSFPEGATIINIERVDENWWAGEYDGHTGLFPSNYVRVD